MKTVLQCGNFWEVSKLTSWWGFAILKRVREGKSEIPFDLDLCVSIPQNMIIIIVGYIFLQETG
jgi:hypothetical protein